MSSMAKRSSSLVSLERELKAASNPTRARKPIWFKMGAGQYGEGDKFIGVRTPVLRALAKKYRPLELGDIEELLKSPIHEYRFAALAILVNQYADGDDRVRKRIFDFYIDHTRFINSWDLVDISTAQIVGDHLLQRSRRVLYRLAKSPAWWERRIAMVATAAFIEQGDLADTFDIATRLFADKHDLIHKAIGWMLREAGDQSRVQLVEFLQLHYPQIPRTTLRYAIEHLTPEQRRNALQGIFA
jgi:3-methyladenine DNA glycosylase AlkD